jgi:Fic family protein
MNSIEGKMLADVDLGSETLEQLARLHDDIRVLRAEGPLDPVSVAKLEEHFRAIHIYHSTGIEGNRLTLQETLVVLSEGIEISGKPLKDIIEVTNLATAYDHLRELAKLGTPIRETDIRDIHRYVVGSDQKQSPGEYRKVGVIITGSEHRPPEPVDVPPLMKEFVDWLNEQIPITDPVELAIVSHHKLVAIHPFVDGNGRVSRLLLNLLLLREGYPICTIRREDRARYYEALSYADIGLLDDLIQLAVERIRDLYGEYRRISDEGRRQREWAERWGERATTVLHQREMREFELWKTRMRALRLEFEKAVDLLNDRLPEVTIDFYDYGREISFEEFQRLREIGQIDHSYAFRINFWKPRTKERTTFMFRYFRNRGKFERRVSVIPLEVNLLTEENEEKRYIRLSEIPDMTKIRLREIFFEEDGRVVHIDFDTSANTEQRMENHSIEQIVRLFLDDVIEKVVGL